MTTAVSVTNRNFDVQNDKVVLVEVSNPKPGLLFIGSSWCPHCVRTLPEWKAAAQQFPSVAFYHYEATSTEAPGALAKREIFDRLNLDGFPSFYVVERNTDGQTQVRPPTYQLKSRDVKGFADLICSELGLCMHHRQQLYAT